ncbi:MAG: NUDIX domain-containing protein [Elusimicrobiota bacterium]
MKKEFSAGGIITKNDSVMIILMNTITGEKVWTFPKGHIEKNETPLEAALREVFEETGVKCKISDNAKFFISHYFFTRNGEKVEKKVYWYLMTPIEETGKIETPNEIEETRWVSYKDALLLLKYPSDKQIIKKLLSNRRQDGF